jgi:hypothetical protein
MKYRPEIDGLRALAVAPVILFHAGFEFASGGLHASKGFPGRFYAEGEANAADLYVSYKMHAFQRDQFAGGGKPRVLVLGDSFARDFANVLLESPYGASIDLVYRGDLTSCFQGTSLTTVQQNLFDGANVVFMASSVMNPACVSGDVAWIEAQGDGAFVVGPKHFGHNLNHFTRLSANDWALQANEVIPAAFDRNMSFLSQTPSDNFIDLMSLLSPEEGRIFVFDEEGRLLTFDRTHLTRYGAQFVARQLFSSADGRRVLAALRIVED